MEWITIYTPKKTSTFLTFLVIKRQHSCLHTEKSKWKYPSAVLCAQYANFISSLDDSHAKSHQREIQNEPGSDDVSLAYFAMVVSRAWPTLWLPVRWGINWNLKLGRHWSETKRRLIRTVMQLLFTNWSYVCKLRCVYNLCMEIVYRFVGVFVCNFV